MADDEKKNNNQQQRPNNENIVEKLSLTVSVIKEKLQLHLHDKETKYMYHGSFNTDDLQKCGFPEQYAKKVDIVAKILETARKGHKQWSLAMSVVADSGIVTVMKEDDFMPLKIVMKLKKTERKETDVINERIKDLKTENQRLREEVVELKNYCQSHCVPKGTIMIWSGNANDVPNGWKLCDGNNGTPDLRNRFVLGASDTINVHSQGGSKGHRHNITVNGHQLTVAEMPSHTHRSNTGIFINMQGNVARSLGTIGSGLQHWYENTTEALDQAGGNQAHSHTAISAESNHLPPYFAMCYIMKVV